VAVKRLHLTPVIVSAGVALITSLAAIVFTSDLGTLLYLVGVAACATLALLLGIAVGRDRQRRIILIATISAFLTVTAGVVLSQYQIRPHLLWLVWSNRYKSEVLGGSSASNSEFKHAEWDGDGWGSAATGDWMGYVVYDPSDTLLAGAKNNVSTEYKGIPCKVILVRRLEKRWYSIVLDMNQFWDKMHPGC
jgi:hypothetical protein